MFIVQLCKGWNVLLYKKIFVNVKQQQLRNKRRTNPTLSVYAHAKMITAFISPFPCNQIYNKYKVFTNVNQNQIATSNKGGLHLHDFWCLETLIWQWIKTACGITFAYTKLVTLPNVFQSIKSVTGGLFIIVFVIYLLIFFISYITNKWQKFTPWWWGKQWFQESYCVR